MHPSHRPAHCPHAAAVRAPHLQDTPRGRLVAKDDVRGIIDGTLFHRWVPAPLQGGRDEGWESRWLLPPPLLRPPLALLRVLRAGPLQAALPLSCTRRPPTPHPRSVAEQVAQGRLRMRETKGGMERAKGAPAKKEE